MNRVELASDGSGMRLRQLGHDIRAGVAAPLAPGEYDGIVVALQAPATSNETRRNLLMLALMDQGTHDGLLQYCKAVLEKTTAIDGFSGYEAASNLALQCLLAKSQNSDYWVRRFEQSESAVLRLVVAEHVFRTDPQRALMAMIEAIPIAGTDHSVTDAIDMWLSNEATTELLAAVDARLSNLAKTQPDSAVTAAFGHARNVIASECI